MASRKTTKSTSTRKKTTSAKKTTAKPRTTKRTSTAQKKKSTSNTAIAKDSFIVREIIIWVTLAVSILLAISNFGMGGFIGDNISYFVISVFGFMGYILPLCMFGAIAFLLINKGNNVAYIKCGAGLILFFCLCMFFELIMGQGGIISKKIISLLAPAIGRAGCYVIVIILAVICIVFITEKSILRGVKKGSTKAYDIAKNDVQKHHEEYQEKRKLKAQEKKENRTRSEAVVKGVTFNTTLDKGSFLQSMAEDSDIPVNKKGQKPLSKNLKEMVSRAKNDEAPKDLEQTGEINLDEVVINRATPLSVTELFADEEPETPEAAPVVSEEQESKTSRRSSGNTKEKVDVNKETKEVEKNIADLQKQEKPYHIPPISLLKQGDSKNGDSDIHLRETAKKLQKTLQTFGVNVTITNISCGPSVTRYELQPELGVKVSKIVGLADDIKLNLAAADIRIEAPIPGKAAVGIEVPNKENSIVMLRDLLESQEFKNSRSKISFATGRDISGRVVVSDIAKMPHLLVAGATGSGKSVCINTLIMSIIYKAKPEEVKLIMIDPKVVELSVYNGIPHLMIPVVTDPKKAAGALNWAVAEMTKRYQMFADYNVRDIKGYNAKVDSVAHIEAEEHPQKMPQIIIIVDELADLMMVAPGEVEESICRLAQLARAAGIHLVLATQRPSVNVITGLIKANMPSRIAFSVSSGVDSRTIIDMNGAEKLLGKGDMLFYPAGYQKPVRVQGAFISDQEVQAVVEYLKENNGQVTYDSEIQSQVNSNNISSSQSGDSGVERDVYFVEAGKFIIDKDKASIGMLQRVFKIGFNRAARIMDQLYEAGVVGEEEGTKPRKVLMSMEEFEQYIDEYV